MNYLPFDLETALKHPERVVTMDGRRVSELHYLQVESNYQPIYCVVNRVPQSNWEGGQWCGEATIKSENDLFLLPEVKECWVNVYEINGYLVTSYPYKSNNEAVENIGLNTTYIKTIRITNEPE